MKGFYSEGKTENATKQRFLLFQPHFLPLSEAKITRAVSKYYLIPPPALWHKLVFCRQMDTKTETRMDGQTSWFQYTPENIHFEGVQLFHLLSLEQKLSIYLCLDFCHLVMSLRLHNTIFECSRPWGRLQTALHYCGVAWDAALYFYSVLKSAYGGSHIVYWVPAFFVPTQFVPGLVHPVWLYGTLLTVTDQNQ